MMKTICFLAALLAGVAIAQSNHGEFFSDELINAFSGVAEALTNVTNIPLSNQTKKKSTWEGNVTISNGKAWRSFLDTSNIISTFDSSTVTYTYTGFAATYNFTFKFTDPFTTSWINGTVSGSYELSSLSNITVKFGINDTNKGPHYDVKVNLFVNEPKVDWSSENQTVKDDISPWLKKEVLEEVKAAINTQAFINLTSYYEKRAEAFVQYYTYNFHGTEAKVNYSMISIAGQSGGLKIIYDGGIVDYVVPSSSIPDFDPTLAPTQALLTKNFIEKAISYPIDKGAFSWSFPDASLRMPDLDFKASDLYFIFPDSIGQFSATDPLKTSCSIKSAPAILFSVATQGLEINLTLTCTVKVVPSAGAETLIMDLSVLATFLPSISIGDGSKLVIKMKDTILQGSVAITNPKYTIADRQQAIIDTLVEEAFDIYKQENNIWGTGFQILPMRGAYYQVREDGILFYSSHH